MKKLYASTVMKNEHTTGTIKYYQILEEKYGIEIVKQMKNYEPESTRIENITDSKEKINKVLEFLTEKFVMPDTAEYIIEDLNIIFESGKFHFITGVSGSGKSTLLETMSLITKKISGEILFNNVSLNNKKNLIEFTEY